MLRLVLRVGCWWGRGPGRPRANKQHEFGRQDRSVQGKGRRDTCAVIQVGIFTAQNEVTHFWEMPGSIWGRGRAGKGPGERGRHSGSL